jgi:hypothetical protein
MEYTGSGIDYPKLTLGGVEYELKLTKGRLMFRMSNRGVAALSLRNPDQNVASLIKTLHALICDTYLGTEEDLAEMVIDEDKLKEAAGAVAQALKKAFPSTAPAQAAAGAPAIQ